MSISVTFEAGNPNPRIVRIVTSSTFAQVIIAGWYKNIPPNQLQPSDQVEIAYSQGTSDAATAMFNVSITSGVVTLSVSDSNVVLPVTANHIAVFTNTQGTLGDDAATAINGGNIQAGLSGTAGYLASFPATSAKGSLRVTGVANVGDTVTTLSNASMNQASVITFPDPGQSTAQVNMSLAALVSGNVLQASGTTGLTANSGIAANTILISSLTSPDVNGNYVPVIASNLTNANIVAGSTLFTPTGSKTYQIIGVILTVTGAFSGGSANANLIIDIGSTDVITGTAATTIKAAANSYSLGQAGWIPVAILTTPITAANPLKLKAQAGSDYSGGLADLSFTLLRIT